MSVDIQTVFVAIKGQQHIGSDFFFFFFLEKKIEEERGRIGDQSIEAMIITTAKTNPLSTTVTHKKG